LSDPERISAFVREHIRSVWALELLLLLRRDPARRWSSQELVHELRASFGLVERILKQLVASGLLATDDAGHRYAPAPQALDLLCGELEAAYRERPVSVISLIARPTDPLQSLADAFRFKTRDR
jgi:DNA-binding IclR family transcriptional regulator